MKKCLFFIGAVNAVSRFDHKTHPAQTLLRILPWTCSLPAVALQKEAGVAGTAVRPPVVDAAVHAQTRHGRALVDVCRRTGDQLHAKAYRKLHPRS